MELRRLLQELQPVQEYDCEINMISIPNLFERYQQLGCLSPTKYAKLAPFMPVIEENWQRALRAGEDLLRVVVHDQPDTGFASSSFWRSTNTAWTIQHLISNHPLASARVILATIPILLAIQAQPTNGGRRIAALHWFRLNNKFSRRFFGSTLAAIGEPTASGRTYSYLAVPPNICGASAGNLYVIPCARSSDQGLYDLALRTRGKTYADAEELDQTDLTLEAVNNLYQKVGLNRSRHIWLVYHQDYDAPVAAAIAYRGPLGLSFRVLENRCDLLVDSVLEDPEVVVAITLLMQAVSPLYSDFAPGFIPVMADIQCTESLLQLGASLIGTYYQGILMSEGFSDWYHHIASMYQERLAKLDQRTRVS